MDKTIKQEVGDSSIETSEEEIKISSEKIEIESAPTPSKIDKGTITANGIKIANITKSLD